MHFRGGGVGHVASREWDEFLQSDRPDFQPNKDEHFNTERPSDGGTTAMEIDADDGPSDSDVDSDVDDGSQGSDNEEIVEDGLVADDGEELDDCIYIEEGYGAP